MKRKAILFVMICCAGCTVQKSPVIPSQPSNLIAEGKLFTALFQQKAAEYKALCFQAYNIARLRLDMLLEQQHNRPLAIITDIDETALDNSPYTVHQGLQNKDFDMASWKQWTDKAAADTVPGACSFFTYAASRKVEIFYVTNRSENERAATIKNLQLYHFPNADNSHLLLRQDISGKEVRRQQVASTHEIILLIGDNLADLSKLYDDKNYESRLKNTLKLAPEFGNRFIVLPNPGYGDWEAALYNSKMTDRQKDSVIKAILVNY